MLEFYICSLAGVAFFLGLTVISHLFRSVTCTFLASPFFFYSRDVFGISKSPHTILIGNQCPFNGYMYLCLTHLLSPLIIWLAEIYLRKSSFHFHCFSGCSSMSTIIHLCTTGSVVANSTIIL